MAHLRDDGLDPVWNDIDRSMGQLFMMGWDGTSVTPQIRQLIEEQYLGNIILTAKNLHTAEETARVVHELQTIAYNAGHPVPLAIALDQENGGVNSLFDEKLISQFPSAMGIAASGSLDLAFDVAKATALEIGAVGVNWILGPVMDVLTNARNQPLGVRTTGDDPQEVSQYAVSYMKGYKEAGLVTCGKHFPSYGNLEFLGATTLDVPIITASIEQLGLSALIPFRNAIGAGIDAIMVGGCAMVNPGMNVMHACLSEQVVDELLRKDLGFDGVVVSECLEMDALSHNIGVAGGTVMAVKAGCDVVLLCRSFSVQQEAIQGLKLGVENGMISMDRIRRSLTRVLQMKSRCTNWEKALNPAGVDYLNIMQPSHTDLSTKAYNDSITVVRDKNHLLPLSNTLGPEEELLLLTPLLRPLAASAASQALAHGTASTDPVKIEQNASVMSGEGVFRELGRSLARQRNGRVLHTSYTANGVRPVHENLLERAAAVILVTADANRNLYQNGFTKHIAMICNMQMSSLGEKRGKPLIVVSVSSPYDFAMDQSVSTYICTYDYTETALAALVKVLYGAVKPLGVLPGTMSQSQKVNPSRQHWLVENWLEKRDSKALDALITSVVHSTPPQQRSELSGAKTATFIFRDSNIEESHFVVRNSSTQALYGFCATYYYPESGTGVIGALFVDPAKRKLSIGTSLHTRAIRALLQKSNIRRLQLGSRLPHLYLGVPTDELVGRTRMERWFTTRGWDRADTEPTHSMLVRNLAVWTPPDGLVRKLQSQGWEFDLVQGASYTDAVLEHVRSESRRPEVAELYRRALDDTNSPCNIIRAKKPNGGSIVGTVILCTSETVLSTFLPVLHDGLEIDDGLLSPVVAQDFPVEAKKILLQGLVLLGIRQVRARGSAACVVDCVEGEAAAEALGKMGFVTLHSFNELSCDAQKVCTVPALELLRIGSGELTML